MESEEQSCDGSDPNEWQIVDGKRKVYYHIPTGYSTLEKPEALLSQDERARDEALKSGDLSSAFHLNTCDGEDGLLYDHELGTITLDSIPEQAIGSSNIGFQMLKKIGWNAKGGLGKSEQGISVPIKAKVAEMVGVGIGKDDEYDQAIQDVTRERRKLDVELEQTVQMMLKKSEQLDRITRIEADVKQMNREFYCDICVKQYKSVAEITAHLDSMDHGHMKRFKEMRSGSRKREEVQSEDRRDSKRLKEERRLAKELEKRMQAAAQSQTRPPPATPPPASASGPIKVGFSFGLKKI